MSGPDALRLTDYTGVDMTVAKTGAGGFGLVFMGPNRIEGGQWCALKTLRPELLALRPHLRDLFIRECLTWAGLWPHANLLNAHSVTTINGQIYLVLDYAEHGNLRDTLALNPPFSMRLAWAQHIAAGLVALHTPDPEFLRPAPLVHRDLKPENILIHAARLAQITDFGLAAALSAALIKSPDAQEQVEHLASASTNPESAHHNIRAAHTARFQTRASDQMSQGGASRAGQAGLGGVGTTAYMPPEQWDVEGVVGPPSDLYAFGLILSELLAGRHGLADLEAELDEETWYYLHVSGTPLPLRSGPAEGARRLPIEVEQLYQRLLAKRPADRPTAREALAILRQAAAQLGEEPYTPYDIFTRTDEHRMMKWSNWATTYFRCDLYQDALACNERALALAPHNFTVLVVRGDITAKLALQARTAGQEAAGIRQTQEALDYFSRALQVPATDEQRAGAQGMRAVQLCSLGRHAEAETAYAAALGIDSTHGDIWFNRAINSSLWAGVEATAGRRAEAQRLYRQAEGYIQQAQSRGLDYDMTHKLLADIQRTRAGLGL